MAFVDEIEVHATAGRGGDGVVRWLHTLGKERGGPSGGDGGNGGDIILEGVRDLAILASYRYTKKFRAEDGHPGEKNEKTGADGADVVIKVPVGTAATILTTGHTAEILAEGERAVLFKGGAGGKGNARFKSSTHQNPFESTPGKPGEEGGLRLELKLIADVGFVGLPNAGKSSLLNALTNARSKVAAYAFTTLEPHLGDFYGHLLADIPGLIEGASAGRGLGSKFLRHVERTGFIAHLISAEQDDLAGAYRGVRKELEAFGHGLSDKPELVVLSKADLLEGEERGRALRALSEAAGSEAIPLSIADPELLKAFSDLLSQRLVARKAG